MKIDAMQLELKAQLDKEVPNIEEITSRLIKEKVD